jgi:hypothetical protein
MGRVRGRVGRPAIYTLAHPTYQTHETYRTSQTYSNENGG